MAERLGRVARLLHRAQQDGVDEAPSGRPSTAFTTAWKAAGVGAAALEAEPEAEALEEAREVVHANGVRRLVHAMQGGEPPAHQLARDRLVGGEHALLDQAMRHVALGAGDLLGTAAQVEEDLRLGQVEVDRAARRRRASSAAARRSACSSGSTQRAEGGAGARVAIGERAPDLGVREACGAPHDAVEELGGARASARHRGRAAPPAPADPPRAQAAEVVRQLLGQHRDHAIREVDARAARAGLAIDAVRPRARSARRRRRRR